jgi:DNA-binding MarR family transcriptional regulator
LTGEGSVVEAVMHDNYVEVISLVERLHRYVLELIKLELDVLGTRDINSVQSMLLFNIGDSEMTIGEITSRGCYMGTNVSYNIKKLVENDYLAYERSRHDRRSIHIRLTRKGSELCHKLKQMHDRNAELLKQTGISGTDLAGAMVTLRGLERFWMQATNVAARQHQFVAA